VLPRLALSPAGADARARDRSAGHHSSTSGSFELPVTGGCVRMPNDACLVTF
jgi:hypothetical protein